MKALYSKIVDVIDAAKGKFIEKDLPVPLTVDLYQGQPAKTKVFKFNTPAIFIDYQIDWEEGSRDRKRGLITLSVHVLVDEPGVSSKRATEPLRKMEYYELLFSILEGITTEETGALMLICEEPVQIESGAYPVFHFIAQTCRTMGVSLVKAEAAPNINMNK